MALPRTQEATAICDSPKGPILRIRDFKAMGAQSIDQANVHKFSIALLCRVPEEHAGASLTVGHVECMCFEALEKLKHSRRGAAVAHGPSWHGGHAVFGLEIQECIPPFPDYFSFRNNDASDTSGHPMVGHAWAHGKFNRC